MAERTLVAVHAHPDDECLGTGGILARYAAANAENAPAAAARLTPIVPRAAV